LHQADFKSEELNTLLALSKSQTYRKIKSLIGVAPNQLIQEFRLCKSLKYLKKTNKTIAEIAFDLGFNSPTYFAKVFRKRFSITPTDFAKSSKTN
jgi:AraC-like DNA-binding protein